VNNIDNSKGKDKMDKEKMNRLTGKMIKNKGWREENV
jgi:hypothetical protein